ncbi:alpha-glucuronidase family glycosyl hydrolase [Oceanobacillus halophilus]|uniref:Xylan alpha-1,2-glucuronidase n=1 Tax=Oceanobacillus halophilus TaxID=930130 RepID=A0A494ZZQ2_9BACI|nr:alpha-glucuronidase family glycosyl hydrolase [Oceanobacillus halophilus]RKQ32483.1 alpha-glucuronidase [Oceanobacillus halophilus]
MQEILNNENNQLLTNSYHCWLQYRKLENAEKYSKIASTIAVADDTVVINSAVNELKNALNSMFDITPSVQPFPTNEYSIVLGTYESVDLEEFGIARELFSNLNEEGYLLKYAENQKQVLLIGKTDQGTLYATFHFLRILQREESIDDLEIIEAPKNQLRMMNQWDNIDGSIERGYSGNSIFFNDNDFTNDLTRVRDYARLLSSVGVNAISINNVNVWDIETNLISEKFLPKVKEVADILESYAITTYLSINYASPMELGNLESADPLNEEVEKWWAEKVEEIYSYIPEFGGFVVKADSEGRPGPFTYGRGHVEGANVLARALKPFNGKVVWRCFVYNCLQDWRDRKTDRARAAYDNFKSLDGQFLDNVILQIKNGPMDFQVREPVSPLLGAMKDTNQVLEFQIAQEYTGQQIDVCYLIPQWKEVLNFDTYAKGEGSTVKSIADGSLYGYKHSGIAAVSNIGDDINWTGNTLAQANFYGFGRLIWNPDLTTDEITKDWIHLTFGNDPKVVEEIEYMLLHSWRTYENYTAPLGVGWMVNPDHHYGPNVEGYEYSKWGTYHFADRDGIGVDRTIETGTGYAGQYFEPNAKVYNSLENCPDELLLFFHHVPYTHKLQSGETVIQHIYNTHYQGVEEVEDFIQRWNSLKGKVEDWVFENVKDRLQRQLENAIEWRDRINTYFYRKSGIPDQQGRPIY